MPPTESTILRNYLVTPAQLPAIITLEQFIGLFPRSLQSSPQLRTLYRDLQRQRNAVTDSVSANIETEAKRSKALRKEVLKAKRESEDAEVDDEMEIEKTLFGATSHVADPKHSLDSILPELEAAVHDVEAELQRLEAEEAQLLDSAKQTVGNLSDLRYGRLSNGKLREQVLEGLQNVQETCERKT